MSIRHKNYLAYSGLIFILFFTHSFLSAASMRFQPGPTNNPPVFESANSAFFEENIVGIVLDVNANDGDGGSTDEEIIFSLSENGVDNELFLINIFDGYLVFKVRPDYENPGDANGDNVYEIEVVANDGTHETTQEITITVLDRDPEYNNKANIIIFNLPEQTSFTEIDTSANTVDIEVRYNTDLTSLQPTIFVSEYASITPESGVIRDFTSDVTYTVTAENGVDTKTWTVSVSRAPSPETDILDFSLPNQSSNTIIDYETHTISLSLSNGADITNLIPTISLSEGATITPSSGASQDFSSPFIYTVIAEDGITNQDWTIYVTVDNSSGPTLNWVNTFDDMSVGIKEVAIDENGNTYYTGYFEYTRDFDPSTVVYELTSVGSSFDMFISKYDPDGNFLWVKTIGGTGSEMGESVKIDKNGDICITGLLGLTADFDPGAGERVLTSSGNADIFILKLSADGDFKWAHSLEGSFRRDYAGSLDLDSENNIYITGYFGAELDFDPSANAHIVSPEGSDDLYILKLNPNGEFMWVQTYGANLKSIYGRHVEIDKDDNVIVTGSFEGLIDFNADPVETDEQFGDGYPFVISLDKNGNYNWARSISTFGTGAEIETDLNGNVYWSGKYYEGTPTLNPGNLPLGVSGINDGFILKISQSGEFVWIRDFGGTGYDAPQGLAVTNSGDLYMGGLFQNTVDLNPNSDEEIRNAIGGFDLFLMKMDTAANFYWVETFGTSGSDYVVNMLADEDGNVFTTGIFSGTVDFDPGDEIESITANSSDAFVWNLKAGEGSSSSDNCACIENFSLPEQTSTATINTDNYMIDIEVAYGTDVSSLSPQITLAAGASISPEGGSSQDFSNPFVYTVTASDRITTQDWTVNVTVAKNNQTDITSFVLAEQKAPSSINTSEHTVNIEVHSDADLSSLNPDIIISAGATISPLSGEAQNFNSPVIYTVTAQNGIDSQDWTITVTQILNSETDILSFEFEEQTSLSIIDKDSHTVDIELPFGTDFLSLSYPEVTLSPGASITPRNTPLFPGSIQYIVTAEDGTTNQYWTVTVTEGPYIPNTEIDILSFSLAEQTEEATIDATAHTAAIEVAYGSDLTNLSPEIGLSTGATISPTSGSSQDFTIPVTYTVTAEDGTTTQDWTVTVTEALSNETAILSFSLAEQTQEATIDATAHTAAIEVAYGSDLTNLSPEIGLSTGATISPTSGSSQDFTIPVTYTVTAEDGTTTQDWTVTVTEALSNETDILSFSLAEQTQEATIDATAHTVAIEVAYGSDLTNLSPEIGLSTGATISPTSGSSQDFTIPVTYTVTAEEGTTTQDWTVTVTEALSNETAILSFSLAEQTQEATIDVTDQTIAIEVAYGSDLTNLSPEIGLSTGANISPTSGSSQDFTIPVTYTVTAEDGTTRQDWTVTVTEALSNETDILSFSLAEQTEEATIDATAHKIAIVVTYGTDVTSLSPELTISNGATVSPASGTDQDFSNPVIYTVTAEDDTNIQDWTVTASFSGILNNTRTTSQNIILFPNPTKNYINVIGIKAGVIIKVIDETGQMILGKKATSNNEIIDLHDVEPGFYFIQFNDETVQGRKILKH